MTYRTIWLFARAFKKGFNEEIMNREEDHLNMSKSTMLKSKCSFENFSRFGQIIILCTVISSCAALTGPRVSIEDFTDQIIEPVATRVTTDYLAQERINITETYNQQEIQIAKGRPDGWDKFVAHGLGFLLFGPAGNIGAQSIFEIEKHQAEKTAAVRKAEFEQSLLWLETQRLPLQQKLVNYYAQQTLPIDKGFAVCVQGKQRQYRIAEGGKYVRMADGTATCKGVPLRNLLLNKN